MWNCTLHVKLHSLYGKHWTMIIFYQGIASEHNCNSMSTYGAKSSNEQPHLEAAFDIRGASYISDAILGLEAMSNWLEIEFKNSK